MLIRAESGELWLHVAGGRSECDSLWPAGVGDAVPNSQHNVTFWAPANGSHISRQKADLDLHMLTLEPSHNAVNTPEAGISAA